MALIECYECGREISSLTPNCIHCGAPRKITKKKKTAKKSPTKESSDSPPLQAAWFLWFFVVGIIVFILLAATGLSLVLPGWAIGLVMGITCAIYTIIRGEDPRGVKFNGELGEFSENLRSGDFGHWLALALIIIIISLAIFAFAEITFSQLAAK